MIIPNKIKIGAHEYQVIRDDDGADEDARFGHCMPRRLRIYVDPRVPQSQQEETLIHEVLHAVCDQVRAFSKQETGRDEEERVVQSLGHGIYQFLKDNDLLK